MPPARPTTVELRRDVLVALCLALGLALLAIAFLFGRYTARPSPQPSASSVSVADAAPAGADAAPQPTAPESSAPPVVTLTPDTSPPRPRPGPDASADPEQSAGVVRYFSQLDQLEASAKTWSDPQQLAGRLVQEGASGDRRGLDELLNSERRARETLRGLSVPPPCREHHAEALALMDEAIALLERLGQVFASQDLTALGSVTTAARAMETRTKRLEALGASLKRQYGIAAT